MTSRSREQDPARPGYIRDETPDVGVEEPAAAKNSCDAPSVATDVRKLVRLLDETCDDLTAQQAVLEKRMRRTWEQSGKSIETTISQASRQTFWGCRVKFKANVIAKAVAPYLVPVKVAIACGGPLDRRCVACNVNLAPGKIISIDLMQEDAIAMVDTPKDATRRLIADVAKIPGNCRAWDFEVKEKANVQDLLATGTFNSIKTNEEIDAVRRVLYIGHDIQTNALYQMEGLVASNPKTNEATYIVDVAEAEKDDILNVPVTETMKAAARFFRPAAPADPRSIKHKLEELYADLSDNVTGIFGRFPLLMLIDLGFHSCICWRWQDDVRDVAYKGTTEILIVGDSGQGKSETMLKLRDFYARGERIDCKSATYAGLVGGLDDFGGRRYMVWGRIPQNDRGAVILDEVKGMPTELIAQLTDVRSSQIAIVTRVGGTRRTTARVRYFWLSNPRGKLRINEYGHGVAAILDLIGTSEDIRRFDAAIIVSSGEVSQAYIDKKIISGKTVPHVYAKEMCRELLKLVWSRTNTVIDNEVKKHIVQESSKLSEKYSPQIPLLEPADARQKIARLSIALAARLGSFTEDWDGIVVLPAHVDVVVEFLQSIYDSENFAFDRWSEDQKREVREEGSESDEVLQVIKGVDNPIAFVDTISSLDWLPRDLIISACGNDKDKADQIIAQFIRSHYFTRYKTSYRKTPKLIALLRKVKDQQLVGSVPYASMKTPIEEDEDMMF